MHDPKTGRLNGVLAAGLTMLNDDLSIDVAGTVAHSRWMLGNGCDGVLLLGTTGEANSFSLKERQDFLDRVANSGLPLDRVMVGTGCCAEPDTVALTKQVVQMGTVGPLALPPFYFKGVSDEELFQTFARIIDKVNEPKMRLYLYHIPQMSGVPFSHAVIERLLKAYPGVVVGLKDSSGDRANMLAMCEKFPGFDVFSGSEAFLLDVLRKGGVGTISASVNVTCPLAGRVYKAWRENDPAVDKLQTDLTALRGAFQGYGFQSTLKEIMARSSGNPRWRNTRPPFLPMKPADGDAFMHKLSDVGFEIQRLAA
jgi:4-hydroxy-tetrahydrodipicolinate synthase